MMFLFITRELDQMVGPHGDLQRPLLTQTIIGKCKLINCKFVI